MKLGPKIVLTGGGSGGHITPLLSLAHALRQENPNCRLIYIGLKGEKLEGLQTRFKAFDEVYAVPAGKFRRYHGQSFLAHLVDIRTLALNTVDFFKVTKGVFVAKRLLKQLKPDVVFSKGGFVAVPVGIAASRLKIPLITHDSDVTAGLANRIVGRWSKIHATGMPTGQYPYPTETIKYVGIPIDERIKPVTSSLQQTYKKDLGAKPSDPVLLVGGAGLGSLTINNQIVAIAPHLLEAIPNLKIFHVTGGKHQEKVSQDYQKVLTTGQQGRVKVIGFTSDFYRYSGAADLVITRAGATTLAELAVQGKAALLIPAPFLTSGQQTKNAERLKDQQAVDVISNDASPEELLQAILKLLRDDKERSELAANLQKSAKPEAALELAKLILATARASEESK